MDSNNPFKPSVIAEAVVQANEESAQEVTPRLTVQGVADHSASTGDGSGFSHSRFKSAIAMAAANIVKRQRRLTTFELHHTGEAKSRPGGGTAWAKSRFLNKLRQWERDDKRPQLDDWLEADVVTEDKVYTALLKEMREVHNLRIERNTVKGYLN